MESIYTDIGVINKELISWGKNDIIKAIPPLRPICKVGEREYKLIGFPNILVVGDDTINIINEGLNYIIGIKYLMLGDKPNTEILRTLIKYLIELQRDGFKLTWKYLKDYNSLSGQILTGWKLSCIACQLIYKEGSNYIRFPKYTRLKHNKEIYTRLGIDPNQVRLSMELLLNIIDNSWYYRTRCDIDISGETISTGYLRYKVSDYKQTLNSIILFFKRLM